MATSVIPSFLQFLSSENTGAEGIRWPSQQLASKSLGSDVQQGGNW